MKYFIYARKSTESEDRQIMSIDSQLNELKEFAATEKLEIAASLCEAKTAKEPGRLIFNEILERIEKGEADGILAWHPDRLARNSIDGGKIIYLVDTNKIKSLKFPTFWFDNTPQGKFMLNIAFGQSKYYIDNLSENVKRGIRQKLRRGEFPGLAPVGYLNDLKTHIIVLDIKKYRAITKIFNLYATGNYPLESLILVLDSFGVKTRTNKSFTASMTQNILKNPFYYGVIQHNSELYQGTHEPIITKKLFDQVQEIMTSRGHKKQNKVHNFIFTGLMTCGVCGCAITAETQKGYTYYRCTKKKGNCNQKYIRQKDLVIQYINILEKVSLPNDWADKMLNHLDAEQNKTTQSSVTLVSSLRSRVKQLEVKLDRLLDSHLDETINKSEYIEKKKKFINKKIDFEEQIIEIRDKGNNWLEQMRDFIIDAKTIKKVAHEGDLHKIRDSLKKVGSNFILKDKEFSFVAKKGWNVTAQSAAFTSWQGWRESNPRPWFWRPIFYHCTTPPKYYSWLFLNSSKDT